MTIRVGDASAFYPNNVLQIAGRYFVVVTLLSRTTMLVKEHTANSKTASQREDPQEET